MWNRSRRHITPSATITVRRRRGAYSVRVATPDAVGEYEVADADAGVVEWLVGRDLSGCVEADQSWLELCDAVSSKAAGEHLKAVQVVQVGRPVDFTAVEIEKLLQAHYREVLSSKEGRAMWRRLLGDVTAAQRLAKLGTK